MRNPPFRTNDAPRRIQSGSDRPLGFLQTIKEQVSELARNVRGLELRTKQQLVEGEPGAVRASRVFTPDLAQSFNFDYLQDGSSSVSSNYVMRDGVTYEIPIQFPPPGVLVVRFMKVTLLQRLYVAGIGPMFIPVYGGDFALRNYAEFQTLKYAFPDQLLTGGASGTGLRSTFSRRVNFFWNLIDLKSGWKFSDELVPDQLMLPQAYGAPPSSARRSLNVSVGPPAENVGGYLEFKAPWPFEHDGQAQFLFRPITPVIQPAPGSGYSPYPFDDRENGGLTRDSSVTLHVELVGTRYATKRDALNKGALVDGAPGGGFR